MTTESTWDEYLLKREKLRLHGVADGIRDQLEAMGPTQAIPIMDELLRADRADVLRLNATFSELSQELADNDA